MLADFRCSTDFEVRAAYLYGGAYCLDRSALGVAVFGHHIPSLELRVGDEVCDGIDGSADAIVLDEEIDPLRSRLRAHDLRQLLALGFIAQAALLGELVALAVLCEVR